MNLNEIENLLKLESPEEINELYKKAYKIKLDNIGKTVYLRGIIEFSNICTKDCYYCGIRKSNRNVKLFTLTENEILNAAKWAYENHYGSVVLQSGERDDPKFITFVENVLQKIKELSNGKLGITISLGEQTKETYKRWFEAGAHRYLLRIESSDPLLYSKLHPETSSFENRLKSLHYLKECGYQVGTGVMIGLPHQTTYNLAKDIQFFKEFDIDMIGMGPFIPHHETPFAKFAKSFNPEKQLELGLKMIAATRIVLKDVNIASSTALHALKENGRELGLLAGANIIMPNVTDTKYRPAYQLYDNKPCINENSESSKDSLLQNILNCNEIIGYDQWGDSPHFKKKNN